MTTIFMNPLNEGLFAIIGFALTKKLLLQSIQVFLLLTALLIIATYIFLFISKTSFFFKKRIRTHLDVWISKAILEELEEDEAKKQLPAKFKRILQHKTAQAFVVNELLATKKSLTGTAANNIVKIYLSLGLKEISLQKLENKKWHIKAKGIQELYVMDQEDMLVKIYRYTNSNNEFIRTEAQTAIVHLSGFKGLRFLDVISYPLTNWQQLKLLDQLNQVSFTPLDKLPNWLQSNNHSVIIFALRLVEVYQQFHVHEEVAHCLQHTNDAVKAQAIQTICAIANDTSATLLTDCFNQQNFYIQTIILDHIASIATQEQLYFLNEQLNNGNDLIKLKAANAIAKANSTGLAYLQKKIVEEQDVYAKIFHHVQAKLNT